jgi:hypothetical protein
VTGTFVYTYYGDDNSPVLQPQTLQGYVVDAYVWSGSAWVTYAGSGDANGNFTIPNVPQGSFMLDVAGLYVYTSARTLDLGSELNGRPSGVGASGASVAGAITNLDAWQTYDSIQWYCPNAAGVSGSPNPSPAVGATSLTSSEVAPWSGNLVDGSHGDVLYLTQLTYGFVGTTAASLTLTRFLSFQNETMTNGATLAANGALTTVAANASTSVNLKASQFTALASQVNPGATSYGAVFYVGTQPGASVAGLFGYPTVLYELYAGNTDVNLGNASFGSPFNASWGLVDYAGESFSADYTATGATTATTLYGNVEQTFPPPASTPTVTPQLSPVQTPTIAGKPLTATQTGVGVTPTVAWSVPATGTPSGYYVFVYKLANSGGATQSARLASIVTTTTSIVLPPGLLTSGAEYVLVISAIGSPIDANTKPFHLSPTYAQADFLSAIVTP